MVIRNTELIELVDPSLPRLIRIVSEYGIMSYFFVLGLEMELKNIFRRRRPTREAVMAYSGIAATYVLLACLQPVIVKGLAPGDRANYIISLGLSLSNTSSTVLTRLITDLKIGKSEIGRLVVNAGVHNDMTTMLLMALFFALHAKIIGRKMDFIFSRTFFIVLFLVFQTWFIRKVGRRGINWINDKNPEGKPISGWHVFVSMIVVAILCAIANMMGYNGNMNAFLIGLTLPREGRVSRAFIRKINIWLAEMIFPLYYTFMGTLLRLDSWKGWTSFKEFSVLVLLGMVGKVIGSVPTAISMGFSISEAVCVGLLLNVKGHYHILAVMNAFEIGVVNSTGLLINIMAVLVTILYIPLVAEIIVWQARKRHAKLQMGLQWHNPDSELRIMTCLHSPKNVPSAIKMIEVTRGRPPSPGVTVFAADLVQLTSRTAATLTHGQGMDVVDVKDEAIVEMREEITMAFNNYLDGCGEGVDINRLLIVSAYNTMHHDICNAAQDALAVLIILPFHKKQRVDGTMDNGQNELRAVNRKVLRHAPCSVGILVDRGLVGSSIIASSLESFQVVVVFIGGPDDREALCYASRVAYYPGVKLTAIRFLLESEHDNISIASSLYGSKNASERRLIMDTREDMHVDDEYFADFYERHVTNGSVSYVEKHVYNGAETIAALRALEREYKLFIIGNGSSHLTTGKAEWEECPELGPLGDNLASSDFSATASLLIIRQHNPKRQEEDVIEEEFSLR
ncbi:cation/H(+) antiporter 28-like [Aristolochia californica]|uniref:cation/H(+) antiporter 28-like n=1 Tax=Aristolochia californica TaxID=171875 RepID=UPI0035DB8158